LKEEVLNFQIPPLERSPSAQPCIGVSRRLSFNKLTNTKNLVLHSSHFALNWCCCT